MFDGTVPTAALLVSARETRVPWVTRTLEV